MIPIGTLIRKIHRQPCSAPPTVTSTPPSTGPASREALTAAASSPSGRPRSRAANMRWTVPNTCGSAIPTPTPWASRATINHVPDGAKPAAVLATTNNAMPATKTFRRPRRSP